jgi:hypothetical protein
MQRNEPDKCFVGLIQRRTAHCTSSNRRGIAVWCAPDAYCHMPIILRCRRRRVRSRHVGDPRRLRSGGQVPAFRLLSGSHWTAGRDALVSGQREHHEPRLASGRQSESSRSFSDDGRNHAVLCAQPVKSCWTLTIWGAKWPHGSPRVATRSVRVVLNFGGAWAAVVDSRRKASGSHASPTLLGGSAGWHELPSRHRPSLVPPADVPWHDGRSPDSVRNMLAVTRFVYSEATERERPSFGLEPPWEPCW